MSTVAEAPKLDYQHLNRELDRCKSAVFLGKTAAFLGSIMCSLDFVWDPTIGTAGTNGISLFWDPKFFERTPKEQNKFVLMHELWHVAKLHSLRRGDRDPERWNQACDHNINLMLEEEGYIMDFDFQVCRDKKYAGWAEEDIYDDLMANPPQPMPPGGMGGDIVPLSPEEKHQVINTVVTAVHQAKMAGGGAGNIPGGIEEILEQFLSPVVPWQILLNRFFTQLQDEDYTWAKPNRRYADMYLPSRFQDDGRLESLNWYVDVSGSITQADVLRFGSELKFVKEQFNPETLTIVQFDTKIQRVDVWEADDPFERINIIGRGGTSLAPVARHILEEEPTAAIIFSDLDCAVMDVTDIHIPIIWVVIPSTRSHTPTYGEVIRIKG